MEKGGHYMFKKEDSRKVVCYVRVSSEKQQKVGFSIPDQVNLANSYAEENEMRVEDYYIDQGQSGTTINRAELQRLLADVSQNKIKLIITRHSDRLVRDLIIKKSMQTVFEMFDVEVITLWGEWSGTGSGASLVSDFGALLDENEAKNVSPRTIAGMRGSAEQGNYSLGGIAPIGYKRVTKGRVKTLEIVEKEAEVIRNMFLELRGNNITLRMLSSRMTKEKILNRIWLEGSVYRIIDNKIYYGHFSTDWYENENHVPAIISKELWLDVQKAVHNRKKETFNDYVYKNKVYCKKCESWCICDSSKKERGKTVKRYLYYVCPCCKKRINEDDIAKEFAKFYIFNGKPRSDQKAIKEIEKQIFNKLKRKKILNKEYDNDLMDDAEFRKDIKELAFDIKKLTYQKGLILSNKDIVSFHKLSKLQVRAILVNEIDKIMVEYDTKSVLVKPLKQNS